MLMAKVVGSIVSTQKENSLTGKKLLIIHPIDVKQREVGHEVVAADFVGAGVGDFVLVSQADQVAKLFGPSMTDAIDCVIVGIIDTFDK